MVQNHSHSGLGLDGEKIDYNNLKNKPSAGKSKVIITSRLASVGTGNQSFSGFGFTPTSYTIQAWKSALSTPEVFTFGGYDGVTEQCMYTDGSASGTATYSMRLKDSTNRTSANFVSFDSDGITVNFNFSDIDSYIMITCFS